MLCGVSNCWTYFVNSSSNWLQSVHTDRSSLWHCSGQQHHSNRRFSSMVRHWSHCSANVCRELCVLDEMLCLATGICRIIRHRPYVYCRTVRLCRAAQRMRAYINSSDPQMDADVLCVTLKFVESTVAWSQLRCQAVE